MLVQYGNKWTNPAVVRWPLVFLLGVEIIRRPCDLLSATVSRSLVLFVFIRMIKYDRDKGALSLRNAHTM